MNKYTICPRYIERCVTHGHTRDLVDVLMPFAQTNGFKILADENFNLINRYRSIDDKNGLCKYWLTLLLDSDDNYCKVKVALPEKLTDYELAVEVAKAIPVGRKIVVRDSVDYAHLSGDVSSNCISLLEPLEVRKAVIKGPVAHFDYELLSHKIVDKTIRMTERKRSREIEDVHNDLITDFLRDDGYVVTDQTRSGSSGSGKTVGKLDMAIRKANGGAVDSIIEALRLSSCSTANKTVAEHINKLLNSYDTGGCARNFILVYAESANFIDLWLSYFEYVEKINEKIGFSADCKLISIADVTASYTNKTDVKVALAEHERNGSVVQVMHIFANFYVPSPVVAHRI